MRILITGSAGFIGKNLQVRLKELNIHEIITFTHQNDVSDLKSLVESSDFIVHLAGANRPISQDEFKESNSDLTALICDHIFESKKHIPIIFSSSIQADLNNAYGISKSQAEEHLLSLRLKNNNPVFIYRLANVFGKWSCPNYNSVIATFCYNIARNIPIRINNFDSELKLVYIDDVVDNIINTINNYSDTSDPFVSVLPEYCITVGELAKTLKMFRSSIDTGITLPVGQGLIRALYSTYLSFLPSDSFSYSLVKHEDPRGCFVEMLKTQDSGQFSFFTAYPGVTRGGHYHHTKTEKFLVIRGTALYRFRHILTDEYYEIIVNASDGKVVETIPGWAHDITNIGNEELIVMLWANEIFDQNKPDTIGFKIQ